VKPSLILLVIIGMFFGFAVSTAQGIQQDNSQIGLFPASGRCAQGIKSKGRVGGREPAAASLQAPGVVKPPPLTKKEVVELVAARLPNQRIVELVTQRGIDFEVDDDFVAAVRKAGANDQLIGVLRKTTVPLEGITVETGPGAQVFLDGNLQGQADSQGVLVFRAKVGPHALKVSQAGKRDFEQSFTLVDEQPARVMAQLADLAGSVRVKAPAGALTWLDDSNRGTVDTSGEILLSAISPGTHALRVTAPGKVDDARSITVAAGLETPVQVTLADGVKANPQDGLKYAWIAPGNFTIPRETTTARIWKNPPIR